MKMAFPVSSSSRCSCRVIAGWVRPSRRAVSVMLPVSTTDISERSIRISRLMRFIASLTVRVLRFPCKFRAAMPKGACADETGFGVQGPPRCSQKGRGATSNMRRELKGCDEAPSAGIGITITETAALGVICASALPMRSRLRSRARSIPSSRRFPEGSS
jgi:hypothetical protein